ncbi:MAG: hypothetical protein WCS87_16135 [Methylococcaceae bacterium]
MIRFIVFLIFLVTFPAYADERHGDYYKKWDICHFLKQLADESAKNLPMQMDSTMIMSKAYALGKTITFEVILLYDRQWFQNYLTQTGSSNEQVEELLVKKAKDTWCEGDSLALIKNGAIIRYIYYFKDQTPYFRFEISQC